ncbi:Bax inhibitor 1 [Wickerhamiella sorbophila]|uniref:Bax inhibitor 1 n=1 Tax=Wickerhamiella sorbophila TaxID=45607 RepID=A0A2T0FG55_9ASCO|nr:Bax inhibitor 1 [Wickerhamiella sorbophila]PRT53976.1 Bax inhibitor 1 [Wickerhamiella sorbophila]
MSTAPPEYTATGGLLENLETPRTDGDHIPDDFKWSDIVAECAIDIRHRFMQRVYLILVTQLVLTIAISAIMIMNPGVQQWAMTHSWVMFVAMFGGLASMIVTMWKRREYPINLIFLGVFTVCEGYMVGFASSTADTSVIISALIVLAIIFTALSAFALQTRYDFTGYAPYLGAALFGLIGFGFVAMFIPSSNVEMAYSVIAVIIFAGYILVDTQMIMTQYHPEDEVAAAVSLYLDIINLFLNLLRILSKADDQ